MPAFFIVCRVFSYEGYGGRGGSPNARGVQICFKLDTSPTHCANIIIITLCFLFVDCVRVYVQELHRKTDAKP
jgi:hypothetical protein